MRSTIIPAIVALSTATAAKAEERRHSLSIYGWLPAVDARISTAFGDLEINGSGSDILDSLQMAFMGAYEFNNGDWGFVGDFLYADIATDKTGPFGFASVDVELKLTLLSAFATYRLSNTNTSAVDVYGGLRVYDMKIDGQFNGGANPTFGGSETWVDPVIGLRGHWELSGKWAISAAADLGGFGIGSDMSGQFLGTVNYALNDRWDLRFGYRYLVIDKPIGGRDMRFDLHGPLLGATYTF